MLAVSRRPLAFFKRHAVDHICGYPLGIAQAIQWLSA